LTVADDNIVAIDLIAGRARIAGMVLEVAAAED
jgi:hypothetical protein